MKATSPVLTKETSVWKAWVGFNASHSLEAIQPAFPLSRLDERSTCSGRSSRAAAYLKSKVAMINPFSGRGITEFALGVAGFTGMVSDLCSKDGATNPLVKPGALTVSYAALILTLLVASCSVAPRYNLPKGYDISAGPGRGLVIGSVGAKPAPGRPPWYEWSRYDFHSLTDQNIEGHITSAFKWNPFHMWGSMPLCPDDGLESECGYLFALLLPPGHYEFQQVTPAMMSRSTDGSFTQSGWTFPLADYRFTVSSGQAVYIGNLLSRVCIGGMKSGNHVVSAIGVVNDMSERDIPLLVAKYPQLELIEITREPIAGTPWLWRYEEDDGRVLPYDWPKECSLEPAQIERYLNADWE